MGAMVMIVRQMPVGQQRRDFAGGEVIAKLDHDNPGVLFATLDLEAVDRARAAIPQLAHDREFGAPA